MEQWKSLFSKNLGTQAYCCDNSGVAGVSMSMGVLWSVEVVSMGLATTGAGCWSGLAKLSSICRKVKSGSPSRQKADRKVVAEKLSDVLEVCTEGCTG